MGFGSRLSELVEHIQFGPDVVNKSVVDVVSLSDLGRGSLDLGDSI